MGYITEYLVTLLWFFAVLGAAYFADRVWGSMLGRVYWVVMAPGVALHELSHALACLVTLARINKLKLFGPKGGEVQHAPSKLGFVGQTIISLAPLAGCAGVLVLVGWLLSAPLYRTVSAVPMSVSLSPKGVGQFVESTLNGVWAVARGIRYSDWTSWKTYVFIYAAICLGICLRPSAADLRHSLLGLLVIAASVLIADAICRAAWQSTAITTYVLRPSQKPLHYLVSFLGLVVALTLLAWLLRLVMHHFTASRGKAAGPANPERPSNGKAKKK